MTAKPYIRIGQIVPSSNTTMETEIPAMLRAREAVEPERFTFHSSRMRMKKVTKEELAAMDRDSDRCALELSDARVDVLGYACLVAIMSMGNGYHRESEARLHKAHGRERCGGAGGHQRRRTDPRPAGAEGRADGRSSAPYMKPLTQLVVDYIEAEGIEVQRPRRARDPRQPRSRPAATRWRCIGIYKRLDRRAWMRSCCRPACRCLRSRRSRAWSARPGYRSSPPRSAPRSRC